VWQAQAGILAGTRDLQAAQPRYKALAEAAIQAKARDDVHKAKDMLREPLRALQSVAAPCLASVRALQAALHMAGQTVPVELVRSTATRVMGGTLSGMGQRASTC
jgi:hypothetical protein